MKKRWSRVIGGTLAICLSLGSAMSTAASEAEQAASGQDKPRVIITNDGEIDDKNSFVRLMYFANDLNIVGLVQSSSFAHWEGAPQGEGVQSMGVDGSEEYAWPGTEWMDEFIDDYAEIYPNLSVHDSDYPTPEYLHSIVKIGNIGYMGEMDEPTEGSEFIKDTVLDDSTEPLYLSLIHI